MIYCGFDVMNVFIDYMIKLEERIIDVFYNLKFMNFIGDELNVL